MLVVTTKEVVDHEMVYDVDTGAHVTKEHFQTSFKSRDPLRGLIDDSKMFLHVAISLY
jgi:hypothetical protein